MSWTPFSEERIKTLPLILAGPILRRVTAESVTVWIALKENVSVRLQVKDDFKNVIMESNMSIPLKIGDYLFISCVTAKVQSSDHQTLKSNIIYTYNIQFSNGQNLEKLGLLGKPGQPGFMGVLNYEGFDEPSFLLPAADKKQLCVAQGSCRKPHGPGRDAMAILDAVIEKDVKNKENRRPQLLILTGDQIYADDVADSLLYMIMAASKSLIGITENIPIIGEINSDNPCTKPGCRRAKLHTDIGFTSGVPSEPDTPKSHLLAFSEYMMMYLFVWSDVLWDGDILPDNFKDVTGKEPQVEQTINQSTNNPTKIILDTYEYIKFKHELVELGSFKSDLKSVRRALANIPVYMIFDDHEVTDDWNLNMDWCNKVLKNAGGRRIIANALAAATICQAWGNVPDQYDSTLNSNSNEVAFLESVKNLTNESDKKAFESFFVPNINHLSNEIGELNSPPYDILWNYSITFDCFELIALDTRTKRWFPRFAHNASDDTWFPILINEGSLSHQIPSFNKDFVIIAFAPPLIGVPFMENVQLNGTPPLGRLENDGEAPGLQPYFLQRFLARLFTAMCHDGIKHGDILLFSGDVHYGFANQLVYSARRPFKENIEFTGSEAITVMQLTASAFKNEVDHWVKTPGIMYSSQRQLRALLKIKKEIDWILGFRNEESIKESIRKLIKGENLIEPIHEYADFQQEILNNKNHIDIIGSEAILIDAMKLGPPTLTSELSNDWVYKTFWFEDIRPADINSVKFANRLLVQASNIGVWESSGEDGVFSLYWYTDDKNNQLPSDPGTKYIINDFFKPRS